MAVKMRYSFLLILAGIWTADIQAQTTKAPSISISGEIFDEYEHVVGWISNEGVVQSAIDHRIAVIDKEGNAFDGKGQRIGKMDKNGAFKDPYGSLLFTVSQPIDQHCDLVDPKGKIVGTVHHRYKNQASAIHCLFARNRIY